MYGTRWKYDVSFYFFFFTPNSRQKPLAAVRFSSRSFFPGFARVRARGKGRRWTVTREIFLFFPFEEKGRRGRKETVGGGARSVTRIIRLRRKRVHENIIITKGDVVADGGACSRIIKSRPKTSTRAHR